MSDPDSIADAGMQAFDDEHQQVQRPGERPDWAGAEEAEARGDAAPEDTAGDDELIAPGTQSPTNEPIGSDAGDPDAFGRGASDTDASNGNWADADDAGASDTGIEPAPGG